MDFSHLLRVLGAAQGWDAWVAVTSGTAETPRAAVLHGSLGKVDVPKEVESGEQGPVAFVPVDIAREPDLRGSVGVALDPAEFEGAEGSLPGDLLVRLRDFNVRVATR
jgi:hypothetical protein